jgi:8-oxo-dGTP diphosphatase
VSQSSSLLFLLTDDKILLAMKKRGFGSGLYNGVGGKPEPGEQMTQTAVRECQEEIGVTPHDLTPVADLTFHLDGEFDLFVSAFICRNWEGEPKETEEMAPEWFALDAIPYAQMWDDDRLWVPEVLAGNFVTGDFTFDSDNKVIKQQIETRPVTS